MAGIELRLAIGAIIIVSIEEANMDNPTTHKAPYFKASQPPGIFNKIH